MRDRFDREITYMRLSVTDRCQLRCRYCMPEGLAEKLSMGELLTYEEIAEVARAAVGLGITRFKVTGGEPLVRRGCADLIRLLKAIPGTEQVTLTTNGVLLKDNLADLLEAGLDAVNISLDTCDPEHFFAMTGSRVLSDVLAGVEAAVGSGIRVKINTVLAEGLNDGDWPEILALAKNNPLDVRFIEMMPIGYGKRLRGMSNETLYARIAERYPGVSPDDSVHGNGPAVYVKLPGFQGSVGFISAIHGKFCGTCNRIRMTSVGLVKPCLCYGDGVDLRAILRDEKLAGEEKSGERDRALTRALAEAIYNKPSAHCFGEGDVTERQPMSRIGG